MPLAPPGWCAGPSLAMKCATRRGMSSLRSRSGGTVHGHDVQAVEEILAEAPRGDLGLARSRLVAETTRTSTLIVSSPPTRSNSRSCSTRRSLICSAGVTSPISSRNSVPLSASSKRPSLRLMAPVKAPFSWPNSSDSSSVSASAPQLTLTNGPSARFERRVDGARHQLLAGARLAVDVDRRVGRRDLLDRLRTPRASPASRRRSRRSGSARRRRRAAPRSRPRPARARAARRAAPARARP